MTTLEPQDQGIRALLAEAASLDSEIRELESRAGQIHDRRVAGWLSGSLPGSLPGQCRAWRARLADLGRSVADSGDLEAERARLAATEAELRNAFQTVFWLARAADRIAPQDQDANAELERLGASLVTDGISTAWLQALRRIATAEQPSPSPGHQAAGHQAAQRRPPAVLARVARSLSLLRRWSQQLEAYTPEVQDLEQRLRAIGPAAWSSAEPSALAAAATDLSQQIEGQAETIRRDLLRGLRDDADELADVGGISVDLAPRLTKLEQDPVRRPEAHARFTHACGCLRELLLAAARSHQQRLRARLGEGCDALGTVVRRLRALPLDDAARQRLDAVDSQRSTLAVAGDDRLLAGLRQVRKLHATLDGLERQAEDEPASLHAARALLATRLDQLAAAAAQIDLTPFQAGLEPPGEALAGLDPRDPSAPAIRDALDAAAGHLDEAAAELLDRYRQRLGQDLDEARRLIVEISATEPTWQPSWEPPSIPTTPAVPTIEAATDQTTALGTLLPRLRDLRATAAADLAGRQREVRVRLASLDLETLEPATRDAVTRRLRALDSPPDAADGPDGTGFINLARAVTSSERLIKARARDQAVTRARAESLKQNFQRLEDDGISPLCPWLRDRVSCLLFGLGEPPSPSKDHRQDHHHQLDLAAHLLTTLEVHATRLVARDTARHQAALDTLARGRDPRAETATKLLQRLAEQGHRRLPPVALRQAMQGLAEAITHAPDETLGGREAVIDDGR